MPRISDRQTLLYVLQERIIHDCEDFALSLCADGIRTFSMAWVIMGHLLVFPEGFAGFSDRDKILPPEGLLTTVEGQ
jgi:hypothetical protein